MSDAPLAVVQRARELWEWLLALPPDFAFLLSLPFVVALAALLAHFAASGENGR